MKALEIFLPGKFENAYIYMGKLVALNEDRYLCFYDLDEIVNWMEEASPDHKIIATMMFSRNDWLVGDQFISLMQDKGISKAFKNGFKTFPKQVIIPDNKISKPYRFNVSNYMNLLLDMQIYNKRIYMGTDAGLLHMDFNWGRNIEALSKQMNKRIDSRCGFISAKYGVINASCGNDGLFSSFESFENGAQVDFSEMKKHVDISIRTGWMNDNLINYSSNFNPTLLINKVKRDPYGSLEREKKTILEIGTKKVSLNYLLNKIESKYSQTIDSIQYTFNSNTVVFVHTLDGNFYSIGLEKTTTEEGDPKIRFTRSYKGKGERIISANICKAGLIIETFDKVWLFWNGEWKAIFKKESLNVRTFMNSKRFQNIVAVTSEEGIHLISLFDDSMLEMNY